MRVLLVEDDAMLADGITRSLVQSGYAVDWSNDGDEARDILSSQEFDMIILDLTLPRADGLELLRGLRANKSKTPVLIITARSEVEDKIRGLDLGADDYMTKPFEMGEFEARVRALVRRSQAAGLDRLSLGQLALDMVARRAFIDEEPVDLPRREFDVLEVLMTRQGQILNKEQIIDRIADFDDEISPAAIEIYISRLRRKLSDADVVIRTIRGVGYCLE